MSTDPDKRASISVNIDIEFPNVPCYLLEIDMRTSVNQMNSTEIVQSLIWGHVDSTGTLAEQSQGSEKIFPDVDVDDAAKTPDLMKTWFDSNMTCQVKGSFKVTKVTGQMSFRLKGTSKALQQFVKTNPAYQV